MYLYQPHLMEALLFPQVNGIHVLRKFMTRGVFEILKPFITSPSHLCAHPEAH